MPHRNDIQGLRGIAVLMVIAYHASAGIVPGGYVGVDVFFVISGYLITRLLVHEYAAGAGGIAAFYERRIRRIVPALVLVVASTMAAGFVILGPKDLVQLARAAAAVMFMSSNLFFWRERDYFADQAPPHALLHTWSIGVEEQFYLAFPLFVRALRSDAGRLRRWLWTGFVASLALSVWLTQSHPAASFYLLPTRAWEFLLGGIATLTCRKAPRGWLAEGTAAAAAAALLTAALGFSGTTPYPGVAAVLPVAGTALLLWTGGAGATLVAKALSLKGFTAIGRVSYSAYLWHWPMFTLARHVLGHELAAAEVLAALAAIALLSQLSWRYVEEPFRRRAGGAPISLRWILLPGLGLLTVAGTTLLARGFPARLPPQVYAIERDVQLQDQPKNACHWGVDDFTAGREFCELATYDGDRILLWGDSHANAIAPAARRLANEGHFHLWQASLSSCPPLLGVDVAHVPRNHRCREFNAQVLDAIRRLHVQRVILAAYWTTYVPEVADTAVARWFDLYSPRRSLGSGTDADNQRIFESALNQTVRSLQDLGVETWLVDQVPVQTEFVPDLVARTALRGGNPAMVGIPLTVHRQQSALIEASVMRLGNRIRRIDPASTLCASGICLCYANGRILYTDSNHLSAEGAYFLAGSLQSAFH